MGAFTIAMSAEEATAYEPVYEYNTTSGVPTIDYLTGQSVQQVTGEKDTISYVPTGENVIFSAEDKIETMDLRYETGKDATNGYQLYVDEYSGEVAVRSKATGEVLFTNPYTIGESTATPSIKGELLSQLAVKFTDKTSGSPDVYYSYEWAAKRGQINVRNIKNGIRVEYTIGREEARMLVPRLIEKNSFEKNLLTPISEGASQFLFGKFNSYYTLQDPEHETSEALRNEMYKSFPITKKMAVYVLDSSTSSAELATLEGLIKTYAPDYTYEDLDDDHMLTEYESEDKNPPLFKMALEYTIDDRGLVTRLPANGIRFNESLYQLEYIEILPYMGAGAKKNSEYHFADTNSGYTFFPDGSGALFDFEKITDLGSQVTVTGKVYGQDFAYHTLSFKHQEVVRYPVYGIVETENLSAFDRSGQAVKKDELNSKSPKYDIDMSKEENAWLKDVDTSEDIYKTRGFVAIVEEGDSLMELSSYHEVRTSEYNSVKMTVYPRPKDTYNVADAISVGNNDTWTVVSARKYTGNYKIRYILLTDEDVADTAEQKAAEAGVEITEKFYECSYVGMAKAYREYLESTGVLTRLQESDVNAENIPLYIETFGALQTTERFLSIPVDVMTPLTTFADIETMYNELSEKGVKNINFIMTGYTKGGITTPQMPYNLKWEGAVDDEVKFDELLADAREKGYGVYPDFDFAYSSNDTMFDGLTLSKHAVKTIDNRYTSKRVYSAAKQTLISYYDLAISPAYFSRFYEKLTDKYLKYEPMGISVSTLGYALNSDFDEDEPFNRADAKDFTVKAFQYFDENYEAVITSGGNAYTWGYIDHLTDIALDSSRYYQAYAAVPFVGMVLHGYVEIAGEPLNMEGNIEYALLKAIENGAALKFILSYRNTNNLKNYEELSQYYSVRYDIWFNDVVDLYNEINDVLKGVQTSLIEHHEFVPGYRVPDNDELMNNAAAVIDSVIANEKAYKDAVTEQEQDAYRNARLELERIGELLTKNAAEESDYDKNHKSYVNAATAINEFLAAVETANAAYAEKKAAVEALDPADANYGSAVAEAETAKAALSEAIVTCISALDSLKNTTIVYGNKLTSLAAEYDVAVNKYIAIVNADPALTDKQKQDIIDDIETLAADFTNDLAKVEEVVAKLNKDNADLYAAVAAMVANYQGEDKIFAADSFVVSEAYVYEIPVTAEKDETITKETAELPVYASDDNKIVYEVYENGTAFLLNFNNYTVIVDIEIDGVVKTYTLDAYGYIVLSKGN